MADPHTAADSRLSVTEWNEVKRKIREQVKRDPNVPLGRYKSPRGYSAWDDLLIRECLMITLAEHHADVSVGAIAEVARFANDFQAPARYLTRELAEALLATELKPMKPPGLEVLPAFRLFLPQGLLVNDEGLEINDVTIIDTAAVSKVFPGAPDPHPGLYVSAIPERGEAHYLKLCWDTLGSTYADGMLPGEKIADPQLVTFTQKLGQLVVNAVLIQLYQPELVTEDPAPPQVSKGFGSRRDEKQPVGPMGPTWIGKTFTRTRREAAQASATGASVRPHWRRGHWHTITYGQGRQHQRLGWFQPVYVNAVRSMPAASQVAA
jgi:hypothetical protein